MPQQAMPEEASMETEELSAPYLPFKTFLGLIERLSETGVPNRIDRTYLSYQSGATQSWLVAALKTFELTGTDGRPTEKLIALVNEPHRRPELVGDLVREYYSAALALGPGATHGELEESFREAYGVKGDTTRKAITFFLNAANFGNVPVSTHFRMPRAAGATGNGGAATPRRRRTPRKPAPKPITNTTPEVASSDALRTRYVEMLMKKVESQDDMDEGLLDRIESLLGYESPPDEDEPED
jgi:hypothetical protein